LAKDKAGIENKAAPTAVPAAIFKNVRRENAWMSPGTAYDRPFGNEPPHHPLWPAPLRKIVTNLKVK
jgi:hypothetical protein